MFRHKEPQVGRHFRHWVSGGWVETWAPDLKTAQMRFRKKGLSGAIYYIQEWVRGAWMWEREIATTW